ncbi:hypothetical protein N7471_012601 [Penicillium samsonianum]|uniref:uncharacterized protein n=1 Tax=Penicillium samsonianum TaxID=1882272 RepID=UPI0025472EFF|nr:uncharacterized protein N7471_012601 [Penicillium samsonianum]KAJ6125284.1 hypothetical protein N7471_012601 [Penicillium samsonianum]
MATIQRHIGFFHPYYALIYLDAKGTLHHEVSPSITNNSHSILTPRVMEAFLNATRSAQTSLLHPGLLPVQTEEDYGQDVHSLQMGYGLHDQRLLESDRFSQNYIPLGTPVELAVEQNNHWHCNGLESQRVPYSVDLDGKSQQSAAFALGDEGQLALWYEEAFKKFNQSNCRVLAKGYIKLIEPRKQMVYPYNGRINTSGKKQQLDPEATKPPWWPSGVSHQEPDHLLKAERIRLLGFIVRGLLASHGITVNKLREADRPIRCQISPPERLQLLDDIYLVRQEEELNFKGAKGQFS